MLADVTAQLCRLLPRIHQAPTSLTSHVYSRYGSGSFASDTFHYIANVNKGSGLWCPDAHPLSLLRQDIDRKPHKIKAVLTDAGIRKAFLEGVANDEKKAVKAFVNLPQNMSNALKKNPKVRSIIHSAQSEQIFGQESHLCMDSANAADRPDWQPFSLLNIHIALGPLLLPPSFKRREAGRHVALEHIIQGPPIGQPGSKCILKASYHNVVADATSLMPLFATFLVLGGRSTEGPVQCTLR